MKARRTGLATIVAVLASLALATGSSAATHVGDDCIANQTTSQKMIAQIASAQPGAVLAVPADGVITRLQIAGDPDFPATIAQFFKVLRPTGAPGGYSTAEQDVLLVKGTTSFNYRLPVKAGDRLGLASDEGDLFFCAALAGAETAFVEGNLPLGAAAGFKTVANVGVPVTATVEPDVDRDGYGDETQDLCPQSALVLIACPALAIDAYAVQTKDAAEIYVAIAGPGTASIALNGAVRIPGKISGKPKTIRLSWKGNREGSAGKFTRFRLKFPPSLVSALKLRGVSLPMKLSAAATNVAGLVSTRKLSLKLR